MATNDNVKICEAENSCKRDAQALCFHCSKNLCRTHLLQHAQWVEETTRTELNLLADRFNELSARFDDVFVSPDIVNKPFDELEKWRLKAYEKINQIVELKRTEINEKIKEYRRIFFTKNDEQTKKITESKKLIMELSQEADVSRKQMNDLQTLANETEKHLQSLTMHQINVSNALPLCYIEIDTQSFDSQPVSNDDLREFKITYVRLNGVIRNYDVKTVKNRSVADLKNSFVIKYNLFEELNQVLLNSNRTTVQQLTSDYILAVEVYRHRIQLQYSEESKLTNILDNDTIVFYEIPYSLMIPNSPQILMPCYFQRLPNKEPFALPIYLNVPRNGCQGRDVMNSLNDRLDKFFSMNFNMYENPYNATLVLVTPTSSRQTRKALSDTLDDQLDFVKINTSLVVEINDAIATRYEHDKLRYGCF